MNIRRAFCFLATTCCLLSEASAFSFTFTSPQENPNKEMEKVVTQQHDQAPNLIDDSQVAVLQQTAQAFIHLAQVTRPAVVFIETEATPSKHRSDKGHYSESQDPMKLFEEEFFRKFFGMPLPPPSEGGNVPRGNIPLGQGSGFIVSPDGYILTNNHVVQDADIITIRLHDKQEYQAEIIGTDPHTDIALLKIDAKELPYLKLGDSESEQVGSLVAAIGNPFGLQATLTTGILSAKGRDNLRITDYDDFLQTDAAINNGNSGGPLTNIKGEVIGINTAIVSGGTGIGFAIPSNMAKYVMKQLLETGGVVRGYLGLSLQPIDSDLAKQFGLEEVGGTIVTQVMPEAPAGVAGVEQGDIILSYNGKAVESLASFRLDISMMAPGQEVMLVVDRKGEQQELTVKLGSTPENAAQLFPSKKSQQLGLELEPISAETAEMLGLPDPTGLVVKYVEPGSPAYQEGIRPNNIVISINREKVSNNQDVTRILKEIPEGKNALFLVQQDHVMRYLLLQVPR